MPVISCRRVRFGSANDETAFFEWIRRNKGIVRFEGAGDVLRLHVKKNVSDTALRDLLALLKRYRISMRQLAQFSTRRNRRWFEDTGAYWFRAVFRPTVGSKPPSNSRS